MIWLLLAVVLSLPSFAAEIEGTVVSAADGRPLKRAEVVLRSLESGKAPLGSTTDENGRFAFLDVSSGTYILVASRSGFISSTSPFWNQARVGTPMSVQGDMKGLLLRLQIASTISGKVRHNDGEAAPGLLVQAYREVYERKRHKYDVAGRAITDDNGEYRLFGLPPGRYYVAAIYTPYAGTSDVREQPVRDSYGQLVLPERTVTTFAPSTYKLAEALQITATPGSVNSSADIFLTQSRTATVRGRLSGGTGSPAEGASVVLLREDSSGTGWIPYPAAARLLQRGEFEIRGVVPGRYLLEARSSNPQGGLLTARTPLVVGNAAEVNANLLLVGDVEISGAILAATRGERPPAGVTISAEPRGEGGTRTAQTVSPDGRFKLRLTAGETYDLIALTPKGNVYLQSARLNDVDVLTEGLRLDASTLTTLMVTVSPRGAEIQGGTQPGANVLLLPENGVLVRHSETAANEWGFFGFRAVAPGNYRVLSWFEEPPCEVWGPNAYANCSRFGSSVTTSEGGSYSVSVQP